MVTSRIWFTAAQKAELWERWKNGQSAAAIGGAAAWPLMARRREGDHACHCVRACASGRRTRGT
jgi:hypothetical protein